VDFRPQRRLFLRLFPPHVGPQTTLPSPGVFFRIFVPHFPVPSPGVASGKLVMPPHSFNACLFPVVHPLPATTYPSFPPQARSRGVSDRSSFPTTSRPLRPHWVSLRHHFVPPVPLGCSTEVVDSSIFLVFLTPPPCPVFP